MKENGDTPVLTETQILKMQLHQRTLDYQSMAHALWLVLNLVGPRTINAKHFLTMRESEWEVRTTDNQDGTVTLEALTGEQVQKL